MNFFKSILLDDSDPPKPENPHESGADSKLKSPVEDSNAREAAQDGNGEVWSFGGLIKTLATRSESVIQTYRRDLQEFGSGLRKETETIREVASRAVKDLPASLEAGTSAAHGVLDGVLKSTADIISKEPQVFASDGEAEAADTNRSLNPGRYSWFEMQLNAIQSDLNTFCEEPEDMEDYKKWKFGFQLENNRDEIADLMGENGVLGGVYKKFVPNMVDHETFWCRYFYRVDKLKQQEKVRANLVKRAITVDDDDDLTWDVDDDEKDGNGDDLTSGVKVKGGDGSLNPVGKTDGLNGGLQDRREGGGVNVDPEDESNGIESSKTVGGDLPLNEKEVKLDEVAVGKIDEAKPEVSVKNNTENVVGGNDESSEKRDAPVVSNCKAKMEEEEEEDLEWDEIEDIGSGDENKISGISSNERANRGDLRKHLNKAAEDDEDLNWDIEDDDEPAVKS